MRYTSAIAMQECPRCRIVNTDLASTCEGCQFDFRNPATEFLYASFWDRLKALWLDAMVLTIPVLLLNLLGLRSKSTPFQIAAASIVLLYFAYMESSRWQGTCGKILVGLRVTDCEVRRISFPRALGRNLGRILSGILGIGYIAMLFTQRKQTLHDMLASCMVLRAA